jgi:flagellar biosynthesis protein FliQ
MKFSAARSDLDAMVVEIELTLVSIIQGVALTVLIENAHRAIAEPQLFFWPYVIAGLLSFSFSGRARCSTSSQ